jgi:magnesium-transporting ATPase (P-type)
MFLQSYIKIHTFIRRKMSEKHDTDRNIQNIAHSITFENVAIRLQVDLERGLTVAEAKQRLEQYGPNKLRGGESIKAWKVLLKQ